jgi:hypothetical protein
VASCLEIVPIRRCVCIDGRQREGNATWDVHMIARAAMSAKNRLPPVLQKFNTFNTFNTFAIFNPPLE